jgi:hypothetical protein
MAPGRKDAFDTIDQRRPIVEIADKGQSFTPACADLFGRRIEASWYLSGLAGVGLVDAIALVQGTSSNCDIKSGTRQCNGRRLADAATRTCDEGGG